MSWLVRVVDAAERALLHVRVRQLEAELTKVRAELETVKAERDKLVRNALRRDKRRGPRRKKP